MLQKIVVLTTLTGSDIPLIQCGVRVASIFRKELCLFFQADGADNSLTIDHHLGEYRKKLKETLPELPVSAMVAPFRGEQLATLLADEHEAILIIAGASRFRRLKRTLLASPVPFLFLNENLPFDSKFTQIIFPVDLRYQNRDAMKWALWFGKFNRSEIIAIGANDRVKENRQKVTAHLVILKKMLTTTIVPHKIVWGTRNSLSIHNEALKTARQLKAGMILLLGSSTFSIPDLLLGLPEEKTIKQAGNIPVLVVNPRRNSYLVCE